MSVSSESSFVVNIELLAVLFLKVVIITLRLPPEVSGDKMIV